MGKPIEEYVTGMEIENTTPGKASTQSRNQDAAFNIVRSLDQGSKQDGNPPPPACQPVQDGLQLQSPDPSLHHGQT